MELPDAGAASPEAVRHALSLVLASDELRSSPQLATILRFVVEATLDGRREAIKGYTIAVEALGRDPSFDPQADPIVRVEATRLRRALERYYAGAGAGDDIEIAIPRGSYVPQFLPRLAAGGEVGEVESAGLDANVDAVTPPPVPPAGIAAGSPAGVPARPQKAARRLGRAVAMGLLALALAVVAIGLVTGSRDPFGLREWLAGSGWQPLERTNRLGIPMIEVRAFETAGRPPASGSSGDFTAEGIEVRVRDALARFDLLDVLASPDARPALRCAGEGASASSAFALGGLVENHDDGTLSVLLRLSDLCDGTIVWSREFDSLKRGGDATALEIGLVRDIMAAIAEPYGVIQARARARVTAAGGPGAAGPYGCVLTAYAYWRSYLPAEHEAARACLEKAVAEDRTFALGYALLAELYLDEIRAGAPSRAATPALNRALAAAEQAVELAPTSAFARRVLMDVHFFRGERAATLAAGSTALELNPYDVDIIADFGGRLIALGDTARGEAMLAQAAHAAPGMPPWVDYHRVIAAYLRGDAPGAAAAADHLMGEGYAPGLLARALASHLAGEDEAARADLARLVAISPAWGRDPDTMIARFFPDAGVARKVRADLAALGLKRHDSAAAN
ncbi:tetratricopeptide repeat protein [Ancylobacter sp. IITR112]|uniref:tetratricopeptide repeat protein n=1 Tax=Ancylobacter sp. IITR112 TaxID=3138073 RepID=UPI00352AE3E0